MASTTPKWLRERFAADGGVTIMLQRDDKGIFADAHGKIITGATPAAILHALADAFELPAERGQKVRP